MLTVPGSMPTTRSWLRFLGDQLSSDVGDGLGIEHQIVSLEKLDDTRLCSLVLKFPTPNAPNTTTPFFSRPHR